MYIWMHMYTCTYIIKVKMKNDIPVKFKQKNKDDILN